MPRRKAAPKGEGPFDLRAAREARSMSQAAAAELLRTAQSSISRWEVEGSMPSIYRLAWEQHWRLAALESAKKGRHVKAVSRPAAQP